MFDIVDPIILGLNPVLTPTRINLAIILYFVIKQKLPQQIKQLDSAFIAPFSI